MYISKSDKGFLCQQQDNGCTTKVSDISCTKKVFTSMDTIMMLLSIGKMYLSWPSTIVSTGLSVMLWVMLGLSLLCNQQIVLNIDWYFMMGWYLKHMMPLQNHGLWVMSIISERMGLAEDSYKWVHKCTFWLAGWRQWDSQIWKESWWLLGQRTFH